MVVLAIDPGPEQSGYAAWNGKSVKEAGVARNSDLLIHNPRFSVDAVVFEQVESYGMAVGGSVFETVFWTGRMFEAKVRQGFARVDRLPRKVVKMHLCGSMRARDSNIRQALIDRFGPPGTKAKPGALYGVRSHAWAALALAVTYYEMGTKWARQIP